MDFLKNRVLFFFLLISFLFAADCLSAQTSSIDSTSKKIEEFMYRLRNKYQHKGFKIRFDAGIQVPVSQNIRSIPVKIFPGFGFNLGIGYGLDEHWSGFVGFTSLSHINENFVVIKSEEIGFDGFHGEIKYKFQPYTTYQFFLESGGGIYELVDQKSEGYTGWGINLIAGFDHFLTNEILISYSIQYRLTRFGSQITGNQKKPLSSPLQADMIGLNAAIIYTFPDTKEFWDF